MLVSDARALGIEFDVNAIPVCRGLEKLACHTDRGRERILGVVNALGPSKSTGRQLA